MPETRYEVVIGLEVHAQLNTQSKVFCGCSTLFGTRENTNICPVCTGQPGVLPVLNKKAVASLVKTGLALGCAINPHSVFARKQYFYPDLPKNYQISQYELPLAERGSLEITVDGQKKTIGITRIHLEEDAGKLLHAIGNRELDHSLVDYNRTGVPLMEIVSEPDLRTPEEAYQYLASLKKILEYLAVSDCDMEEGKFRCDANVSIRPFGQKELGTKAELKNMNSLKGVRDALTYEIKRQINVVLSGGKIIQETRLWDAATQTSQPMRTKEEAHDYRYFPEPDLVPLAIKAAFIDETRNSIPELPHQVEERFIQAGLTGYVASVAAAEKPLADFVSAAIKDSANTKEAQDIANWVLNDLLGKLGASGQTLAQSFITPEHIRGLVALMNNGTISGKIAKTVFDEMFVSGKAPEAVVKEKGLVQINDLPAIARYCDEAIQENAKAVDEYKSGKEKALGALVGCVMKKSQGKANPGIVNTILKEKLS